MMWPRPSKEFSEVAQLQAVSHSRGICCHLFWENPAADRSGRRTGPDPGEALAKGSIGGHSTANEEGCRCISEMTLRTPSNAHRNRKLVYG
jgi:hypothetical protein